MEIACRLQAEAKKQGGVESLPFAAVGQAMAFPERDSFPTVRY